MRKFLAAVFCLGLAGLLFFSLRPAHGNSGRTKGLPKVLATWINAHDNVSNFLAYAGMSTLAILLVKLSSKPGDKKSGLAMETKVIISFALLVSAIEIIQIWIPGRVADFNDVLTAWAGLLAGWGLISLIFLTVSVKADSKPMSL
jgi:VanZ family protein